MKNYLPSKAQTVTLCAALLCGLSLNRLGAPLPFMFGSLLACLILAFIGAPLQGTKLVSTVSRTILGVAIGASITWAVLAQVMDLAPTLLVVPFYVFAIAVSGLFFFHKIMGYDKVTAYYAAMPGALQDMVVFGEEAGANTRSLSLIHATRLVLMVSIAPLVLIHGFGLTLDQPLGPSSSQLPVYHNAFVILIGVCGWLVAKRIGIFGASIVGPLLLAIPLSLTGLLPARPSAEVIMVSQYFIGIGIGANYQGITRQEIRRDILAASGFVFVLLTLAGICFLLTGWISDLGKLERFLAFWPAGQAEIAILSLAAGINVGVVVIHHLMRIVMIILGAPYAARILLAKDERR